MNKKAILNFIFFNLFLIGYISLLLIKSSSGPVRYDWIPMFYIPFTFIFWLVRFILRNKLKSELLLSIITSFITYLIVFIITGDKYIDLFDFILSWVILYIISGMYILAPLMAMSNWLAKK